MFISLLLGAHTLFAQLDEGVHRGLMPWVNTDGLNQNLFCFREVLSPLPQ